MYIKPGSMVLLGGSGAGKTTFLNAVSGYERAKSEVVLNSGDVCANYKKMQYEIGFVPRQDLMRGSDTVLRTLTDAALLLISSLAHTTTMAMTIMPFLPIVRLIFSGGFFSLPSWSQPLTNITVSRYGLRSIAALGDYNELPAVTAWNTLSRMTDTEVSRVITTEDLIRVLRDENVRSRLREMRRCFSVCFGRNKRRSLLAAPL